MPNIIDILYSQALVDITMQLEKSKIKTNGETLHQNAIVRLDDLLATALGLEPIFKLNISKHEHALSRPLQEKIRAERREVHAFFMAHHTALLTLFFEFDGGLPAETARALATLVVNHRPQMMRFFNVRNKDLLSEPSVATSRDKAS